MEQATLFEAMEAPRNQREARFMDFHKTNINIVDARPDGEALKINDHHKPYYARLWMKNNPNHKGVFGIRSVEGDNE